MRTYLLNLRLERMAAHHHTMTTEQPHRGSLNKIISLQNIQRFSKLEIMLVDALLEAREDIQRLRGTTEFLQRQISELRQDDYWI